MQRAAELVWKINAALAIARVFKYLCFQSDHFKNNHKHNCKTYTKLCVDDFLQKNHNETIDADTSEHIFQNCCQELEQFFY
jgi:hypothetical protein